MASKKYNRYFIIFQEEDKGFGIAIDKQPTGYTKIETRDNKCKITVYVQNLVKSKGPYICYMIDASKTPIVTARLGEIVVDDTGRGETSFEYDENNIADTKKGIENFSIAAVVVEGDNLLSPLAGYYGKERIEWKDKLLKREEKKENEVKEKPEEKEVRIDEKESEHIKKFLEYEEKIKMDINITENIKEEKPKEDNALREDNIDLTSEKTDEGYEIYNYSRGDTKSKLSHAKVFHELLKNFEEQDGICSELKGCRWWKIPFKEDYSIEQNENYPYLCTIYHPLMAYPYINYITYIKRSGHYYFGLKYDDKGEVKAVIYGIEGYFNEYDQPYRGMTGFTKWFKLKDDKGIWTMFYNPYTGCIMIPKF